MLFGVTQEITSCVDQEVISMGASKAQVTEEVRKHLSQYTNVVELMHHASLLKAGGTDSIIVNKVMTELRKELVAKSSSIVRLKRVEVPEIDKQPVGYLQVNLEALQRPLIKVVGDMIIM